MSDRQALEHVLGRQLTENQRVIIRVETMPTQPLARDETADNDPELKLPDWCDVYAGLTDEEIAEIEKIALTRADMTRTFE